MANDFLVLMDRNKYDIRGHCKKRPVYIAKKSINQDSGIPLQVHLDQIEGLNVPADTSGYPNEKDYDWGHVVLLNRDGGIIRTSFREALGRFYRHMQAQKQTQAE